MLPARLTVLAAATMLACLCGCRQACVTSGDAHVGGLVLDLDDSGEFLAAKAESGRPWDEAGQPVGVRPVATVTTAERPRRPISLAECICLALENGRTGEFYDQIGGGRQTSVNGLSGQSPSSSSDSIRVFAYDPAIAATTISQSLARFDAVWKTVAVWDRVDPVAGLNGSTLPAVGVLNGLSDTGQFGTELLKPLATGGVAGITFRTDYGHSSYAIGPPLPSTAVQPGMDFTFEQPLLQGAGVLINQVRDAFPTALRQSIPSAATPPSGQAPGILIARINRDQTQLEFERRVHELFFAVEAAYWDLYSAYWDLYTRDSGIRQAQLAWQVAKQRFDAGGIGVDDVAQIEEQYHFFRTQRLEALGRGSPGLPGVLEAERHLRYVVGLPVEDGNRLVPTDSPVTSPVEPDWESAVHAAQQWRPELLQIHKELQVAQLALVRAKDYLNPDLRFFSKYSINGLAGSFPGGEAVAAKPFSAWEAGIHLEVPIGFRAGNAEVTRARLQLAQRFAFLRDQESNLLSSLQRSYRDVVQFREEMLTRRSQREAAEVQLKARYVRFKAKGDVSSDLLVRTQRSWADALRDEYVAICKYNIALADFERQKGTIPQYHNVTLVDGQVPAYAQEHASQQVRQRNQSVASRALPAPAKNQDPADQLTSPELLDHQPNQLLTYVGTGDGGK